MSEEVNTDPYLVISIYVQLCVISFLFLVSRQLLNIIYLDVSLFGLSVLNVFPKVIADGSEGGVHFYTEVTPESNGSFIHRAFLFR